MSRAAAVESDAWAIIGAMLLNRPVIIVSYDQKAAQAAFERARQIIGVAASAGEQVVDVGVGELTE